MVAFARQRFAASPLFIGGHSLGGHVTALYAALAPAGELAGVFGVAAGSTYFRGWRGLAALRILGLTQAAGAVSLALGYFPGQRVGFAGLEPRTQMTDWARAARTGRFAPRGDAYDYEAHMAEVTLPALAVSIGDDDYAPSSAARQLYGKLVRARLEFAELPVAAFGRSRVGHFSWVKTPEPVVARVRTWIDGALSRAAVA
jgi:predicted alpha/beta hydrolase